MSAGRPTLYDPEYCERVLAWGAEGKSKAWMCAHLGVTRQTLENWTEANPEFLDAFSRAMLLSQAWWEDVGQDNIVAMPGQGSLNGSVYGRSMAARFPADWREKSEQTLQGPDGQALTIITRRVIDPKTDGTGSRDA